MNSHPRVSVIVPTYNCGKFLAETLNSVLAQKYEDYELIVVNDGSTDNTDEVLSPFRNRLVYICQPNKGLPAALNAGLKAAKGELIAILDADDLWHEEKLAKQVDLMDNCKEVGLCYTNFAPFGERANYQTGFDEQKGSLICYPRKSVGGDGYVITSNSFLRDLFVFQGSPKPSSVLFRRECIEKAGFFDETLTFCQDTQMSLRIAKYFNFGYVDQCLLFRRVRSDSLGTAQSDRRYILEHIHMYETLDSWIPLTEEERSARNNVLAGYCLAAGYLDFSDNCLASSRSHLWKSLRLSFSLKTLCYLVLSFIPKQLVPVLRRFKRQVNEARSKSLAPRTSS
jgi:glycosyltransferase involved in cell wall biosynthesis